MRAQCCEEKNPVNQRAWQSPVNAVKNPQKMQQMPKIERTENEKQLSRFPPEPPTRENPRIQLNQRRRSNKRRVECTSRPEPFEAADTAEHFLIGSPDRAHFCQFTAFSSVFSPGSLVEDLPESEGFVACTCDNCLSVRAHGEIKNTERVTC